MSAEDTLIQVRKDKHHKLNGGKYPVLNCGGLSISEVLSVFERPLAQELPDGSYQDLAIKISLDPQELGNEYWFRVRGRVSAFRKSGGIAFLKLTDESASMQLIANKNVLTNFDQIKLLDLGDIITCTGRLCYSKAGEKSLLIDSWDVITKSHRPPPEKWAGITDLELKYRKRYLDLMSDEESRARLMMRSYLLRAIRQFMDANSFIEIETSTLTAINSGANAKPFTTHHNALDTDLYLRIAPELNLKRLLVGGFERVYEIGRSYRNEGISTRHNPEFTMLEFYEAYGEFEDLFVYTINLFHNIDLYLSSAFDIPGHLLPFYQKYQSQRTFSLKREDFKRVSMREAVELAEIKANSRQDRIDLAGMERELSQAKTEGQKLSIKFEYCAEPFLTEDYRTQDSSLSVPVFITEYPADICPLARQNDDNPEICDRFELYIDGKEICNAFQELNDPDEQARRFKEQLETNHKDAMDFDSDYIEALEYGMPQAIGFGMGVDRALMLLTNAASIKDVILFPAMKPLK